MRIILSFIFLLTLVIDVNASTYYVDYSSGNDSNDGLSQVSPWKHSPGMAGATSIPAATTLIAGDIVYFKKGVIWPSAALPLDPAQSGTSGNVILYQAKSDWGTGNYAIFDAEGIDDIIIDIDNYESHSYLTFDGFDMRNPVKTAIHNRDVSNLIVRNFKVSGVVDNDSLQAPILNKVSGAIFENGYIDSDGHSYGFQVSYSTNVTARNLEIVDCQDMPLRFDNNSHNGIIEFNYVHSMRDTGINKWAFVYRSSDNGTIRYNIFDIRGLTGSDVRGMTSWTLTTNVGHKVYNNIIIGEGIGIGYNILSNYNGFNFYNNIFYDLGTGIDSSSDATIKNNDFYSNNTNWTGSGIFTTANNITTDPLFVNINSLPNGAQLFSNSNNINAGFNYDGYVGNDFWGTSVPQNSVVDIGIFEYYAQISSESIKLFGISFTGTNFY